MVLRTLRSSHSPWLGSTVLVRARLLGHLNHEVCHEHHGDLPAGNIRAAALPQHNQPPATMMLATPISVFPPIIRSAILVTKTITIENSHQ
ncbi:Hypothetical protein RG540_CH23870 [Neorhizobium galegae bv. orientalis str. HAMBI 540]|uniref:Uncharacterized protein n=1 Tax=Neorhizobium galegae bv. orientalis str. HAMBI 540 TaxID=1028800 RepID=A0A068SU04_NEOGA|nr:Hypothetical protein RG540_CH23870 [Neorhizobium galegae bv. orientalis str. HAMBI 540]